MSAERQCYDQANITVSDTLGTSTKIRYDSLAGGLLIVPANGFTTLTWWVSYSVDGGDSTFVALFDRAGAAVTQAVGVGAGAYPIPDQCYGAGFLKVTRGAGADLSTCRVIGKT